MLDDTAPVSMKKAVLINAAAKYTTVIIQLIYTAILSRILTPTDYGTVAVVNVFIVFFHLLTDMGLGTGVIQDKSLSDRDVQNVFSVTVYMGILLAVIFAILSYPISKFYRDDIYIPLGCVLSISLAFHAFNMIPNAQLLKAKRFKSIAIRTIVISILSFTLTIIFALTGAGVYALAAQSVLMAIGVFVWNICSTRLRFRLKPDLSSVKKIWGYSMYQFGAQALNYFNRNLDNLLIGKFFSKAELGYYNKAYTLMQYPINYLPGVITPVLHPILSEHQDDTEFIYTKYIQLLKILSLLGCFGSSFCFFAGRELILIAFGAQWEAAVNPFKILSLSLWMQLLTNTTAPIYQSLGNTKLMFKSLVMSTAVIVTMIVVGVITHNIFIISILVSAAYILNFFITFFILLKYGLNKSFTVFMFNFEYEALIFATLMIIAAIYSPVSSNIVIELFLKFIILFAAYLIMLFITRQQKHILRLIKK